MNHVVATLKPGSRGEEVKCLNNFIVLLLDEGAALLDMQQPTLALNASQLRELITQNAEYYGPVTELLISLFQKKQRLPETGETFIYIAMSRILIKRLVKRPKPAT